MENIVLPIEQTDPEFANLLENHCNNSSRISVDCSVPNIPIVATVTVGRNSPCPCKSGLKYKKCCMK